NELASTGTGAVHRAGVDHAAGLYIMRGGNRVHLEAATTAPDAASRTVGSMVFLPTGPSVKVGTAWQKLVTASELTDAIEAIPGGGGGGAPGFGDITGAPADNSALASALGGKFGYLHTAVPLTGAHTISAADE